VTAFLEVLQLQQPTPSALRTQVDWLEDFVDLIVSPAQLIGQHL